MKKSEIATFAGGCFWCFEPLFDKLKGIEKVTVGYANGKSEPDNDSKGSPVPTYERVSTGQTGFAEAFQIKFDPNIISFDQLLDIFFYMHDPTTLNRQGNDCGTQYRSAIFYNDKDQEEKAKQRIKALTASKAYQDPIVTEVSPLKKFFIAEDYHQKYFEVNPNQPYCNIVIRPKMEKFQEKFKALLK